MRFKIYGKLPGLNELIENDRIHWSKGAKLKRETETMIALQIMAQRIMPVKFYPVRVNFEWHEIKKNRDLDNISSAKKYILDALQKCGVLNGDGQKYVCDINDIFVMGDTIDGVVVEIEEGVKFD